MNRVANPVVRALLRSPLHRLLDRHVLLLGYTGCRTGRRYIIPVAYRRERTDYVVRVGGAERKTWWRNLRGGAPVTLHVRGRDVSAKAQVLDGPVVRIVPNG